MYSEDNRDYWNSTNADYSKVWLPKARQQMSKKELTFIKKYLQKYSPATILDVGIGNGRILENLIRFSSKKTRIFGIDISKEMIDICRNKFRNESKIKQLKVCDASQEPIGFKERFDLVTMIRVLKYNENWKDILKKVFDKLNLGGVYIFTMPNKISISRFSGDTFSQKNIPILYSDPTDLQKTLIKVGFKDVEFCAFSKLPNFMYHICENKPYIASLLFAEKLLELLFGKTFLGRELFVVCMK